MSLNDSGVLCWSCWSWSAEMIGGGADISSMVQELPEGAGDDSDDLRRCWETVCKRTDVKNCVSASQFGQKFGCGAFWTLDFLLMTNFHKSQNFGFHCLGRARNASRVSSKPAKFERTLERAKFQRNLEIQQHTAAYQSDTVK